MSSKGATFWVIAHCFHLSKLPQLLSDAAKVLAHVQAFAASGIPAEKVKLFEVDVLTAREICEQGMVIHRSRDSATQRVAL